MIRELYNLYHETNRESPINYVSKVLASTISIHNHPFQIQGAGLEPLQTDRGLASIQEQLLRRNVKVVPRRARISGSQTCVSLNSRLESDKEEERRG